MMGVLIISSGTSFYVQPQNVPPRYHFGYGTKKYQNALYCLELVPLRARGEKISSHPHKTGSWYVLEVLVKISDEHPLRGGGLTLL